MLDELLKDFKNPQEMVGDEFLRELKKAIVERAMEAELTAQLGYEKSAQGEKETTNRRNGHGSKQVRTEDGILEIKVPRDRDGEFEPTIIAKHQKEFKGFDDKILSMYSRGMTTREIQGHLKDIYAIDVSPDLISRVTDSGKEMLDEWRSRSFEPFYPVVFLDALRINVRESGQIVKKSVYLALAIRLDGQKELLGMWTFTAQMRRCLIISTISSGEL